MPAVKERYSFDTRNDYTVPPAPKNDFVSIPIILRREQWRELEKEMELAGQAGAWDSYNREVCDSVTKQIRKSGTV